MTSHKVLVLCAFISFQRTWAMPATATAPSYGAQFQADFSKNLATVMNNLHTGATTLANPPIKFGFDTVPNLIQQGISTATDKINKITAAGKEGLQKLGVGAGHTISGGGVLGSSIAAGSMQVAGHGLGVGVNVADAGAKAGIDFLGHVGDNAASGISVGTEIGGSALSTLGNGMIAAGTGVNVMSNGLAALLDVIGSRLSGGINKAEQVIAGLMDAGVLKLENGALSFSTSAQANVYNILNSFLQILINVQKLFDGLRVSINTGVATSSVSGSVSGNANSGAASPTGSVSGGANPSTKSIREVEELEVEEPTIEEPQPENVSTVTSESEDQLSEMDLGESYNSEHENGSEEKA